MRAGPRQRIPDGSEARAEVQEGSADPRVFAAAVRRQNEAVQRRTITTEVGLTALLLSAFLSACGGAASVPATGASTTATTGAPEPGPTDTDPDKYKVVFENERLRVLRYHDVPGTKTALHHHPDSFLYALGPFRRRLHFPDGRTKDVTLVAGDVLWVPAQSHVGENVGTTDCDVILVEPKR